MKIAEGTWPGGHANIVIAGTFVRGALGPAGPFIATSVELITGVRCRVQRYEGQRVRNVYHNTIGYSGSPADWVYENTGALVSDESGFYKSRSVGTIFEPGTFEVPLVPGEYFQVWASGPEGVPLDVTATVT